MERGGIWRANIPQGSAADVHRQGFSVDRAVDFASCARWVNRRYADGCFVHWAAPRPRRVSATYLRIATFQGSNTARIIARARAAVVQGKRARSRTRGENADP